MISNDARNANSVGKTWKSGKSHCIILTNSGPKYLQLGLQSHPDRRTSGSTASSTSSSSSSSSTRATDISSSSSGTGRTSVGWIGGILAAVMLGSTLCQVAHCQSAIHCQDDLAGHPLRHPVFNVAPIWKQSNHSNSVGKLAHFHWCSTE
jgi:hypothetical protein